MIWRERKKEKSTEWKKGREASKSISTTILGGIEIKLILEDWYFSSICVDTSSLFFINFSIFSLPFLFLSFSPFCFSPNKRIEVSTKIVKRIVLRLDSAILNLANGRTSIPYDKSRGKAGEGGRGSKIHRHGSSHSIGHLESLEFRPSRMVISGVENGREGWIRVGLRGPSWPPFVEIVETSSCGMREMNLVNFQKRDKIRERVIDWLLIPN